jgi:hypothetical protein
MLSHLASLRCVQAVFAAWNVFAVPRSNLSDITKLYLVSLQYSTSMMIIAHTFHQYCAQPKHQAVHSLIHHPSSYASNSTALS